MVRYFCLAGLAVLLVGCSTPLKEYTCAISEDCVGSTTGRCEPSGHCSFADDMCPDGFRFGEASGSESGVCVGEEAEIPDAAIATDGPGAPDAASSAWGQRHRLDFNNLNHAEDLVDFPVLVVLTTDGVDYSLMQSAGQDLRFTNPAGDVQLPYEIEVWDPAGTSYVWVKPQQIDASSDTDHIYVYYNNPEAADGQNASAVWSNGYEGVYHLAETGDTFANSAGPTNDANNAGTTSGAGAVGTGRVFDGLGKYIKLNNGNPVTMAQGVAGVTLTAWVHPVDFGPRQALVSLSIGGPCVSDSRAALLFSQAGQQDELMTVARSADGEGSTIRTTSGMNVAQGEWSLVSTVIDVDLEHNDSASNPYGVITSVVNDTEQVLAQTARFSEPATANTPAACGSIGAQDDGSDDFFEGMIDEVRISSVDRSTIWLQAQYQSMQDNDYVRFGAAEIVDEDFSN